MAVFQFMGIELWFEYGHGRHINKKAVRHELNEHNIV